MKMEMENTPLGVCGISKISDEDPHLKSSHSHNDPADNSSVEELPCRLLDPPLATMLSAGTLLEPPPWELRTQPANTQTAPLAAVCTPTLKLDHRITRK